MKPTCLLSFSGGLDSLAAALQLESAGFDVTLGHIEWLIQGTSFGEEQTAAAKELAHELDMPLLTLASMWFPADSYAKYSWVPVCISTMMHHAGDGCVYPGPMQQRYDRVAFGFDAVPYGGDHFVTKRHWLAGMREYAYRGDLLFPNNGKSRWAGDYDSIIPMHLRALAASCYEGVGLDGVCPGCPKCEDRR